MESQQVNELSPKTLGNYIKKASADAKFQGYNAGAVDFGGDEAHKHPSRKTWPGADLDDKAQQRLRGVNKAVDKLTKEDVVTEAFGRKQAIDILVNLRAIAKQAETRREPLPQGFGNQLINDLYEVILYIEKVAPYESVEEASKPDFLDVDDDGDKEEPMKKAVKDKVEEGQTIQTKTGLIHKGTYGNSYQPSDDDEDDDAPKSTEPKKKGRPAKNKGPERVTSKAWKHKGGRKANESKINLDTYVEDVKIGRVHV